MQNRAQFISKLIRRLDRLDAKSLQIHISSLAHDVLSYENILNYLPEGVMVVSDTELTYINRRAAALLHLNWPVSLPKNSTKVFSDKELSHFISFQTAELHAEKTVEWNPAKAKNGLLHFRFLPLKKGGQVLVLISPAQEDNHLPAEGISPLKQESLIRLSAGIAHEIGNPLNSIVIHLALLQKRIQHLSESERKGIESSLDVIQTETARMDRIIKNFLKAARKPPLRFRSQDLNEILQSSVDFMRPELEQAKIAAQFEADKTLPCFLMDEERLRQVFINLIKNAMEAMPHGGNLSIKTLRRGKQAFLSFKDEGMGISENDLPHIFDAYYTTKPEGAGLGLMTVLNAVQEHGGRVEVSSREGKGTIFVIRLPIREPNLQLPQPKSR